MANDKGSERRFRRFHMPIVANGIQSAKFHLNQEPTDAKRAHRALDGVDRALDEARQETLDKIRAQGREPGESSDSPEDSPEE